MGSRIIATASGLDNRRPRTSRRLGLAGGVLLLAALLVRTDLVWLGLLSVGGILCVAASCRPLGDRGFVWMASINGALAALLLWAAAERAELLVDVADREIVATLGTAQLRAPLDRSPPRDLVVAMAPQSSRPLALPRLDGDPALEVLLSWVAGGLSAGVEGASVTGSDGTMVVEPSRRVWQAAASGERGPGDWGRAAGPLARMELVGASSRRVALGRLRIGSRSRWCGHRRPSALS